MTNKYTKEGLPIVTLAAQLEFNLPKIKDNDLVAISYDHNTSLFYSNGKVAQIDLVIINLEAELAKIEVPDSVKEEVRKSAFDEYGRVFSKEWIEELAQGQARDAAEWYKKSHLIDNAISEGYLKEVVDRFSMDVQLKHTILRNHNTPLLLFGTRGNVLDLRMQTHT